jgi:molybdopterin molybdotransferase
MLSVEEALRRVLSGIEPTAAEAVAIEAAAGRVLAETLTARLTQPPFAASAMDGYAVRVADVALLPARLKVIGQAAAGHPFRGTVGQGEAVRIFTGAPVPAGADAVVIQENAAVEGAYVTVLAGGSERDHIRPRGLDFSEGEALLPAGLTLGPREVTLAAAMGYGELPVRRRPSVAILATGDELVAPGVPPGEGQIVCSNVLGVAALTARAGGEPRLLGIARDNAADLEEALARGRDADVLVTVGGASVGDHDLIGPVLTRLGMALEFWKIALRPGKPLLFGRLGGQRVLGLPGNPVSALICARLFLVPLVRALLGLPPHDAVFVTGSLAEPIEANGPRQHYMRVTITPSAEGGRTVHLARSQDSSLLSALASAGGLLVRPPGAPALPAGAEVKVMLVDF